MKIKNIIEMASMTIVALLTACDKTDNEPTIVNDAQYDKKLPSTSMRAN